MCHANCVNPEQDYCALCHAKGCVCRTCRDGSNWVFQISRGRTAQLHRLVTEERPGACMGCGFEHNCRRDGCAVLRKVSRIVTRGGDFYE